MTKRRTENFVDTVRCFCWFCWFVGKLRPGRKDYGVLLGGCNIIDKSSSSLNWVKVGPQY